MKPGNTTRIFAIASLSAMAFAAATGSSWSEPIGTVQQMDAALQGCWAAPANSQGSSVTLSFGLNSDGTLLGPPQATAISVPGDDQAEQAYLEAATKALESCLPLQFSPSFAQGLAGNVYTVAFSSK